MRHAIRVALVALTLLALPTVGGVASAQDLHDVPNPHAQPLPEMPEPILLAQFGLGRSRPVARAHAAFESDCDKCHGKRNEGVPAFKCLACHKDIADRQKKKRGLHASKTVTSKASKGLATCWQCHHDHLERNFDMINGTKEGKGPAWKDVGGSRKKFQHAKTGYRLVGGHRIDCDKCHDPNFKRPDGSKKRSFLGNNQRCLSCHKNYHEFVKANPLNDCQKCHNFAKWTKFNLPLDFNHNTQTKFPLRGAHAKMQCQGCHPKGKPFAPLAHGSCETCHKNDGRKAHVSVFGSKRCTFCHTERRWGQMKVSVKEHKKKLSEKEYDPKEAHLKLGCTQCHRNAKKTPKDGRCMTCHNNIHGDDWMANVNAEKSCSRCHNEKIWETVSVTNKDHKDYSKWELTGQHLEVSCLKCHRGAPSEVPKLTNQKHCGFCHWDSHNGTRGEDCTKCHSTKTWYETTFDHNKQTRFPLVGMHNPVTCEQCHPDPNTFKQRDHSCSACHGSPHLGKLSDDCEDCHQEEQPGWEKEIFDHNTQASFRLNGRHMQAPCFKCHMDMGFAGTPSSCRVCHWDYHKGEWGVSECKECHSTTTWLFDRRRVIFENLHNFGDIVLTGSHEKVPCETCHAEDPKFIMDGLGGECVMCHTDVHFGALGTQCYNCHKQQEWLPSTFRHADTGFPLSGAHRVVACRDCHKNNIFGGTPDECVFCHTDDIQKSNHGPSPGATFCTECHYTTVWRPQRPGALPP